MSESDHGASVTAIPGETAQSSVQTNPSTLRKGIQLTIILLGVILGINLLLTSSFGAALFSPAVKDTPTYDPSLDPKIGSLFPLPTVDVNGKALPRANRTVVVIAGECTSCSLQAIDPREAIPLPGDLYLFVYQMPVIKIPDWRKTLSGNVRVLADSDRSLLDKANAIFQPRFLLLDKAGGIASLSTSMGGKPDYVRIKPRRQ